MYALSVFRSDTISFIVVSRSSCQDEPLLVSCGVVQEQCQGTGIFLFVAEFCGWLMKHKATSGDHDKPDDDDKV